MICIFFVVTCDNSTTITSTTEENSSSSSFSTTTETISSTDTTTFIETTRTTTEVVSSITTTTEAITTVTTTVPVTTATQTTVTTQPYVDTDPPFILQMENESLKILQLTDLHLKYTSDDTAGQTLNLITSLINSDNFDLVIITGDMTLSPAGPAYFLDLIETMEACLTPWTLMLNARTSPQLKDVMITLRNHK
jgi:hypothetical protein